MLATGLEEVDMHVVHHHNTIVQYFVTHTILDLCMEAERRLVAPVARRW